MSAVLTTRPRPPGRGRPFRLALLPPRFDNRDNGNRHNQHRNDTNGYRSPSAGSSTTTATYKSNQNHRDHWRHSMFDYRRAMGVALGVPDSPA
jgi:hypothetical protein